MKTRLTSQGKELLKEYDKKWKKKYIGALKVGKMENNIFFKCKKPLYFMINRSFYLYRLKYPKETKLPDFYSRFADSKIKENILDISVSEDEIKKHLLIIVKKEGNYLYGLFYKLKPELIMDVIDEEQGAISRRKLEEKKAWAEKSHFIIDLKYNLILGEYNDSGIRFFQQPLGEYLRTSLNESDLEIEVVYDKENYEKLEERKIKYFKVKVAKPKLTIMENVFGLSGLDVFEEADDSQSLFLELKINAGRGKSFNKSFVKKIFEKFNIITDKQGIKKFEVGQSDFDTPLELVKDKVLRRKVDIEDKLDDDIFSDIVSVYKDLNLNELLDLDEENE